MIRKREAAPASMAARPPSIDFTRFGDTPREVRLTRGGLAMTIAAGLIAAGAVALALGLSIVRARQTDLAALLQRDGAVTDARIVALSPPRGDERIRVATFDYTVAGALFTGTVSLNQRESRNLAVGDTIGLRYLRSDPQRAWIRGHEPGVMPLAVIPPAAAALLALAGVFVWRVQRDRTLLSEGRFAFARVTVAKRRQHEGAHRVKYEFTTLSGATCVAHCVIKGRPPDVGAIVPVVYHRDNPLRTALYPLSLVTPMRGDS